MIYKTTKVTLRPRTKPIVPVSKDIDKIGNLEDGEKSIEEDLPIEVKQHGVSSKRYKPRKSARVIFQAKNHEKTERSINYTNGSHLSDIPYQTTRLTKPTTCFKGSPTAKAM